MMSKPQLSSRLLAGAALALAVLTAPVPAKAITFPADTAWIALTRGGAAYFDVLGDGVNERDIVGDATHPSAYIAQDSTNFYFRLRLDKSPLKTDGTFSPFGWGCAIDTNNDGSNMEFIAMVNGITNSGPDGNPDRVEYDYNPTPTADSASDIAEVTVATFATTAPTGYARSVVADSMLGGDPDYFIDFAIPLSTMRAPPMTTPQAPGIPSTTTLRFACGSSNNAQRLNADPLSKTGSLWSDIVSDPVTCGPTSCASDRDGDGVPDSVETTLGTDPTKVDSDGDGINDNVELSPSGSTTGPFSKIDTDGDGTADALDLDSDNDCATDTSEKATWRDATKPNVLPSLNCPTTAPVCNATNGTCVAGCTTDANCGSTTSGLVCSGTTCVSGCRGTGGNGCPTGSTCSSTTSAIGTCSAPLDTDGDTVPDAVETTLGTDPTKADSDGDGINDNVELSPTGSTTGPFAKIDTDGDGTIDALDLDSDNDCATDTSEKTTWRNPALPNASASANCPTASPFCDVTVGICGACGVDVDCGSATSGMVCNGSPKACIAGCRGVGGNTCAAGFVCSSTTTAVGTCSPAPDGGVDAMTDTSADTSIGDAIGDTLADTTVEDTGTPDTAIEDTGSTIDSSVVDSTVDDTGADSAILPEVATVEGGGCSCSTPATSGGSTFALLGAALLPLLLRRRRRN